MSKKHKIFLFSISVLLASSLLFKFSLNKQKAASPLHFMSNFLGLQGQSSQPIPLNGNFNVSSAGSATYRLSFPLPPWNTSISPSLGLSYSSDGAESFIGYGWAVSGFSRITLCSQNYYSDQTWSNANAGNQEFYHLNRLCIDGKRLVSIKGDYGKDGSEYRTTLFNGMRVISRGICGNGPCFFEVWEPNGNKRIYGTANSTSSSTNSVLHSGQDIYMWGLSQTLDPSGNQVLYEYMNVEGDSILYPSKISYGGNEQKAPSRIIQFNYQIAQKNRHQPMYVALTNKSKSFSRILQNIETKVDNQTVLTYSLNTSLNNNINSYVLNSVGVCGSNECYAPTTFSYEQNNLPSNIVFQEKTKTSLGTVSTNPKEVRILFMDKYGDGHAGLSLLTRKGSQAVFTHFRNDGEGNFKAAADSYSFGEWNPTYQYYIMDKNGDGLQDIVHIYKGSAGGAYARAYISQSDRPNFSPEAQEQLLNNTYNITDEVGGNIYLSRDIDGNGLNDLVEMTPRSAQLSSGYSVNTFFNARKGGFPKSQNFDSRISAYINPLLSDAINFQDINGDSFHDMYVLYNTSRDPSQTQFQVGGLSLYRILNQFQGPTASQGSVNLGSNGDWESLPAYLWFDYNRDGLADLLLVEYNKGQGAQGAIWLNTGGNYDTMLAAPGADGNITQKFSLGLPSTANKKLYRNLSTGDVNGDGLLDLLLYLSDSQDPQSDTNTGFEIFINNGISFQRVNPTQNFGAHTRNFPTDLNGDGLADILSIGIVGGQATVTSAINQSKNVKPILKSIDNGIGGLITVNYEDLLELSEKKSTLTSPEYPYTHYRKPKIVVSSYQLNNGGKNNYAYTRTFSLQYSGAMFNRQNWQLSSFSNVTEVNQARNLSYVRSYYTQYPLVGRQKSYAVKTADGERVFNEVNNSFDSVIAKQGTQRGDQVILIRRKQTQNTTYGDDGTPTTTKTTAYNYFPLSSMDGQLGNIQSSSISISGSPDILYHCYTYQNIIDDKKWAIGLQTGVKQSKLSSCNNFNNPFQYKWDANNDYRLLAVKYDQNIYQRQVAQSYYYNKNESSAQGWTIISFDYNDRGLVKSQNTHLNYQNPQTGKFGEDDQIITLNYEYDGYDFIKNKVRGNTGNTLTTSYIYEKNFGQLQQITSPNGRIVKRAISDLGLTTSVSTSRTPGNMVEVQRFNYSSDDIGYFQKRLNRVSWDDSDTDNWHYNKTYFDGLINTFRVAERSWDDKNELITQNVQYEKSTGRVSRQAIPSYNNNLSYRSYSYTDRGRIKSLTQADGSVVNYTYTYSPGFIKTVQTGPNPKNQCDQQTPLDEVSVTTIQNYEKRQSSITYPDGTSEFRYFDIFGQLIKYQEGRGLTRNRYYDSLARLVENDSPDSGVTKRFYNALGLVSLYTFSDKTQVNSKFNNLMQLISKTATSTDGKKITRTYKYSEKRDGFFNNSQVTSLFYENNTTYNYNYNLLGLLTNRLVQTPDQKEQSFTLDYGPLRQLISQVSPNGVKEERLFYNNGLLKSVSYNNQLINFSNYNAYGTSDKTSYSNGIVKTSTRDIFGQITNVNYQNQTSNKVLLDKNYCYNQARRLVRETDSQTKKVKNYQYDILGRLTSAQNETYTYDASGNLTKKGEFNFVIDSKSNKLTSANTSSGDSYSFQYDPRGRLVAKNSSKEARSFAYGPFGRLSLFKSSNGNQTQYQYGDNGLFIREVQSSKHKKQYRLSNTYEIEQDFDSTGEKTGTPRLTKRVRATEIDLLTNTFEGDSDSTYYPVRDWIGNRIRILDEKENTVKSYEYSPYGEFSEQGDNSTQ